ncbi:MAG: hypothetical protein C0595_06990 [Marinilabiliales bacterium]|nr:MAG: hypothetical protein C0595_06990 [Marinilabiliales bacterium]
MKTNLPGNIYISWILRILLIIIILVFALFSLDVFEDGKGIWEIIADLFMHNLPSLVMIIILFIAWRNELMGGVLLLLGVIGFGIFLFFKIDNFMYGTVIMLGIPFLIGIMFVINHYLLGKKQTN